MIADANKIEDLKKAIVKRFNHQLYTLQIGHPYKKSKVLTQAIDLVEYLEECDPHERYNRMISYYIDKLGADYKQ